jgi:hypothetical protein
VKQLIYLSLVISIIACNPSPPTHDDKMASMQKEIDSLTLVRRKSDSLNSLAQAINDSIVSQHYIDSVAIINKEKFAVFEEKIKFGLRDEQRHEIIISYNKLNDKIQKVVDDTYPENLYLPPESSLWNNQEKVKYWDNQNAVRNEYSKKLFRQERKKFIARNNITEATLDSMQSEAAIKGWW